MIYQWKWNLPTLYTWCGTPCAISITNETGAGLPTMLSQSMSPGGGKQIPASSANQLLLHLPRYALAKFRHHWQIIAWCIIINSGPTPSEFTLKLPLPGIPVRHSMQGLASGHLTYPVASLAHARSKFLIKHILRKSSSSEFVVVSHILFF
jgi:hypothetical protein